MKSYSVVPKNRYSGLWNDIETRWITKVGDLRFAKNFRQVGLSSFSLYLSCFLIFTALIVRAQDSSQNKAVTSNAPPATTAHETVDIHNAASNGDVGKVSELLKKDPSLLESRDDNGMTPLLVAARDGKPNVVTLLIAKGASITAATKTGDYDALSLAAKNGQKDVVAILLDKGSDASRKDSDGDTPITLAQNEGQTEVLALFKAHGGVV